MNRLLKMLCAAGLAAIATPAGALSTAWVEAQASRIRLVAAETALGADGEIFLGLEITMEPGWKTYWRTPGEAGIPPFFDWSASENLGSIEVSWPVPRRIEFFGMDAFTYQERVVLPLRVTAVNPGELVNIKLNVGYGVCSDLCILEQVDLVLPVPAGEAEAGPEADLIATAIAAVPLASLDGLEISDAVIKRSDDITSVEISVTGWTGPGDGEMTPEGKYDVFLEAGPEFLFGRASYQAGAGEAVGRFLVPMVAGPEDSLQGVALKVTAVSPKGAIEVPLIISDP